MRDQSQGTALGVFVKVFIKLISTLVPQVGFGPLTPSKMLTALLARLQSSQPALSLLCTSTSHCVHMPWMAQIFGPREDELLDAAGTAAAFAALAEEVNAHELQHGKPAKTIDEVGIRCKTLG